MSRALWILQGLLSFLFIFGGCAKLAMPIDELTSQLPVALPGALIQFASLMEIVGGLGLVLPGLLRIQTGLAPLAAAGLTLIMVVAVALSMATGDMVATLFPLVTGLLTALVAYSRAFVAPHGQPSRRRAYSVAA